MQGLSTASARQNPPLAKPAHGGGSSMTSDRLLEYAQGCFRLADEASDRRTKIQLQRLGLQLLEAAEIIWHRARREPPSWSVTREPAPPFPGNSGPPPAPAPRTKSK